MADEFVFTPHAIPSVAIAGSRQRFPVHRIYCVGRNYADHAREMGTDPRTEPPVFFTKPPDAVTATDAEVPYPPRTASFHHEIELVVAIGRAGSRITAADALNHVFGYAAGIDLTRRDLQQAARKRGEPWDVGKAFDFSAPVGAIRPVAQGHVARARMWLKVNNEIRQQADVGDMIWSVPEIIAALSDLFELQAGDLIYTGTPAGVGALQPGDRVEGGIEGLESIRNTIIAAA
jgi:fumarylpyruvate hydrolase